MRTLFAGAFVATLSALVLACGSGSSPVGFAAIDAGGGEAAGGATRGDDADVPRIGGGSGGGFLFGDSAVGTEDAKAPPSPTAIVYAHSADTLYRLDPNTNQVSVVGAFDGCTQVIDLALDANGNAYVTTMGGFYTLDLRTAKCVRVASGVYPNSLSFVPKGTLDPNTEALVGYFASQYVRIDPATGAVTTVGQLTGGYFSSGDIVSVINGGTFLTVIGVNGCRDCLLQVDPKTGNIIQNYGSLNHAGVYGIAFWAGTVYGFDKAGQVFSIGWNNNQLVTTDIPVPNPPPGLSFWGAGSTTAAPPTSADGGGVPILQ
jgi:hypothetical protein